MSTAMSRAELEAEYRESAQAYLASLPLEHFMEATPQATQREISVQSFALLRLRRPDVHYFNELLVQYLFEDEKKRPIVPDNMIVLYDGPIDAEGSYDVELQPVGPLLVLEYVSKSSKRKDYETNFRKYERELEVPYYLLFYPQTQDLSLFHLEESKYASVTPNDAGRLAVPELDLEVAILDGWARYWYRGELLPLPADLQRANDRMSRELRQEGEKARQAERKARQADDEARLAKEKARQADDEARLAKEKARQADDEARLAKEKARQSDEKLERLLAQMRAAGVEPTV